MSAGSPSPYQPGSAAQPPVLAGREHLLRTAEVAVAATGNRRDSFQVLYGPRGVGKTVLLDRYAAIAAERGWAIARHEARAPSDPVTAIVEELHGCQGLTKRLVRQLRDLRERWGEETQQVNLGVYRRSAKRQPREPRPLAVQFGRAVVDVATEVTSQRRGLMILIDEVQEIDVDTLGSFGPVIQDLQRQRDLTVMIVFGGLPDAPGIVTAAFTYGERMKFFPVENLSEAETAHALVLPARDGGRNYEPAALDTLIDATGGYPFFVQLYGEFVWVAAGDATVITVDHVETGLRAARDDNDNGLYRARWSKLPPGERDYLAAMAAISTTEPVTTSAIAAALGKKITSASDTRARLLDRGILVAESGRVAASIPGFLDYVRIVQPLPTTRRPTPRRREPGR